MDLKPNPMRGKTVKNAGLISIAILFIGATPLMSQNAFVIWETVTPAQLQNRIDEGFELDQRDEYGFTALMSAASRNDNPEVIATLLDAGADLSARTEAGNTPLMFAAMWNDNPEIVTTLIDAGADPSARDVLGLTVLMLAVLYNDNPEVLTALIDAGADLSARHRDGSTALMLAAVWWTPKTGQRGKNALEWNREDFTPWHDSERNGTRRPNSRLRLKRTREIAA